MHKSRLAGFIIDCRTDDLPAAADFWGAALGMPVRRLPAEEGERYIALDDPEGRLHVEVQSVDELPALGIEEFAQMVNDARAGHTGNGLGRVQQQ